MNEKSCKNANNSCKYKNMLNKLAVNALGFIGVALTEAGKLGAKATQKYNELKDADGYKSQMLKEQARVNGVKLLDENEILEICAKRLNAVASEIKFDEIHLSKNGEYFYDAKLKFNAFLYEFKLNAQTGEIIDVKVG